MVKIDESKKAELSKHEDNQKERLVRLVTDPVNKILDNEALSEQKRRSSLRH
jgi:hypothetical protein